MGFQLGRVAFAIDIAATDIESEISAAASADAAGKSRALTVGARKLLDIMRALPEGSEVTMALAVKRLQVRSGKSRFQLQTLPAEDFPRLGAPEGGITAFQLPQRALKAVLALVQYAMAQQDIRYYLNGLLMVVDAGELRVVATDGHRLAVATRAIAPKELGKQEVIVPRKTVLELAKLLQDTDEPVSIELSGNQARFRFDGVLLASKLVDGKFPDYQRVIPSAHPKQIKVARQTLGAALQRAAILTSDKFRGVRWVLGDGSLKITGTNTEQEEAHLALWQDSDGGSRKRTTRPGHGL